MPLLMRCCLIPLGRQDSGAAPVGRTGRLRSGRGRHRQAIGALVGLLLLGQRPSLAAPSAADTPEDFGRWERQVTVCLLSLPGAERPVDPPQAAAAPVPAAASAQGSDPGSGMPPPATAGRMAAAAGPGVSGSSRSAARAVAAGSTAPTISRGAPAKPPAAAVAGQGTAVAGRPGGPGTSTAKAPAAGRAAAAKAASGSAAAAAPAPAAAPTAGSAPTAPPPVAPVSTAVPRKAQLSDSGSRQPGAQELLAEPPQETLELEQPCRSVRLDQQLAGLLTIRFLPSLRGASQPATQLTYTGVLAPRSQPMGCRAGRCDLQGDLELRVSAVAISALDRMGLPIGLPQAFLARGYCSVAERRVNCQARVSAQRSWAARARW